MPEAVDFFKQALDEEGISANIKYSSDEESHTFWASKGVDEETLAYTVTIYKNDDAEFLKKRVAMAAQKCARHFKSKITDEFIWGGRCVEVIPYDTPSATCKTCGSSFEMTSGKDISEMGVEMSSAMPSCAEQEIDANALDDYSTVLLKMYLIGKLREECDEICPNSVSSERFI